jgi:hypothetical protein
MIAMFNAYKMSEQSECSKVKVGCWIEVEILDRSNYNLDGIVYNFGGYNKSPDAPSFCPRNLVDAGPGERYDLCSTICGQKFHAELHAIDNMLEYINEFNGTVHGTLNEDTKDVSDFFEKISDDGYVIMTCYIYGQGKICDDCKQKLTLFGFNRVFLCKNHCDIFNINKWQEVILNE